MANTRRADISRSSTTDVFGGGVRLAASSAKFINDAEPPAQAFQLHPARHAPKRAIAVPHSGAPTRAALTMASNNFFQRRDRGWRRRRPFRFYQMDQEQHGQGNVQVGNAGRRQGMSSPRQLLGLLPNQTSSWQPYQYPVQGGQ